MSFYYSGGSRISWGGAPTPEVFDIVLAINCIQMKKWTGVKGLDALAICQDMYNNVGLEINQDGHFW